MKSETEVATIEKAEIQPANLLQALVQVATTPGISIDVIERMVALQERQEARQAQTAFFVALSALQAEIPLIHKGGRNNFTGSTYARREDLHSTLKPLLAKHGFAFSFNEESREGDLTKFSGKLSHKDGHAEIKYRTLQTDHAAKNRDGKPTRTGIQDDGSTTSYACRYLMKMHLDIAETDEDTDGNSAEKITKDQVLDLNSLIDELKMDKARFLVFMGAGSLEDILATDWKKAMNAIDAKRRSVGK